MDDEMEAALERLIEARQKDRAAEAELNRAIVEFVNLAASKAKLPEGFAS